mgnify:CR=1 FL=1
MYIWAFHSSESLFIKNVEQFEEGDLLFSMKSGVKA